MQKTTSTNALRFIVRPQTGLPLKRTSLVDVVFCILDHTRAEAGAVPAGPGKWKLAKKHLHLEWIRCEGPAHLLRRHGVVIFREPGEWITQEQKQEPLCCWTREVEARERQHRPPPSVSLAACSQ